MYIKKSASEENLLHAYSLSKYKEWTSQIYK